MGTLTRRWVVSLTDHRLTPQSGFPTFATSASSEFDSTADSSRRRDVQSVALPRRLSRSRSCFDMFRLEPAVAEFDGPFTPTRRSEEGIVGHHPCRPPRSFRHASPCPRVDHSVSGRLLATPRVRARRPWPRERLRPCRFPCACLDDPVRLAVRRHSLGRFSKRTT